MSRGTPTGRGRTALGPPTELAPRQRIRSVSWMHPLRSALAAALVGLLALTLSPVVAPASAGEKSGMPLDPIADRYPSRG